MSAEKKSEATHEKFNQKVVKFLLSLGAVSTNNSNYPDQYLVETIAGSLSDVIPAKRICSVFYLYKIF